MGRGGKAGLVIADGPVTDSTTSTTTLPSTATCQKAVTYEQPELPGYYITTRSPFRALSGRTSLAGSLVVYPDNPRPDEPAYPDKPPAPSAFVADYGLSEFRQPRVSFADGR